MNFEIVLLIILTLFMLFLAFTLWCCVKIASKCDDKSERFWSSTNIDTDEVA